MTVDAEDVCPDEKIGHSQHGPVQGFERVARAVTSPRHTRKDGGIRAGVFPPTHLLRGELSVTRVDVIDLPELKKQIEAVAGSDGDQTPIGVLLATAVDIRNELSPDDSARLFCVVDAPTRKHDKLPDNEAHAHIGVTKFGMGYDGELQGILMKTFAKPIALEKDKDGKKSVPASCIVELSKVYSQ